MNFLGQSSCAPAGTARQNSEALHQGLDRMRGTDGRLFTPGAGLWTCGRNHRHEMCSKSRDTLGDRVNANTAEPLQPSCSHTSKIKKLVSSSEVPIFHIFFA